MNAIEFLAEAWKDAMMHGAILEAENIRKFVFEIGTNYVPPSASYEDRILQSRRYKLIQSKFAKRSRKEMRPK